MITDAPPKPEQPAEDVVMVERIERFTPDDLDALCESTDAAILDGGGFGWVASPGRRALEAYYRGVVLVPERVLFVARLNGHIVGAAHLQRPPRNNEAQAFAAHMMHAFIAPYARGHRLATALTRKVEEFARESGYQVLNLDVRETQVAAIRMYETLGYERWGEHPEYALVRGTVIKGFYYAKRLRPRRGQTQD